MIKNPSALFTQVSQCLTDGRLRDSEALIEEILSRTPDARLQETIYLLHDWSLSSSNFKKLAEYFNQDKPEIDSAIELFRRNRDSICNPKAANPDSYPLLQTFLLFDCLMHVFSIKNNRRTIGYLENPPERLDFIKLNELISDERSYGRPFNFSLVGDHLRILDKSFYHSEAAEGLPVEMAGEIAVVKKDGKVFILLSPMSGHYRPHHTSLTKVCSIIDKERDVLELQDRSHILSYGDYLTPYIKKITGGQDLPEPVAI